MISPPSRNAAISKLLDSLKIRKHFARSEVKEVFKVLERNFTSFLCVIFVNGRKFENEVVSMTAWMLHGDSKVVGSVTSGGTESCLMAVKTHRDRARQLRPKITKANVVGDSR